MQLNLNKAHRSCVVRNELSNDLCITLYLLTQQQCRDYRLTVSGGGTG